MFSLNHGDCLDLMQRMVMQGMRFDALITDPPYCAGGITEAGKARANGQGLRKNGDRFRWFEGDNMTSAGISYLMRRMAVLASSLLSPQASMLVFCDWRMVFVLGPAMESAGFRLRNILAWDKGSMGLGTGFRPRHELILHLTQRSPKFFAADVGNVVQSKRVHSSKKLHPTEKPIDLLSQLINVVCPKEGSVLDPFAGSGATGVACANLGRRFIGIEKDAAYFAAAKVRIEEAYASAARTQEAG